MMNKVRSFLLFFLFFSIIFSGLIVAQARTTQAILGDIFNLLSEFNFNDAIALFDTINPAEARSAQIRLIKASVLASAGKAAEARAIAEAVIKEEPNNIDALYVLSSIESALGKTKEQRTLLERILKEEPGHIDALTDMGKLFMELRQYKNAAPYFDRILAIQPDNMEALLGRARIYRLEKDPKNAEALYNKAVTLHPYRADVWQNRARLYRGMGFPVQALEDLNRAKSLDPADYWIAIDRGSTLLDLNRKSEALDEYQRAIGLNPNEFIAYAYTSGIKDEMGDIDGAGRDYEALARLKPDYPYAFEGLGFHKMRDRKWAEAKDAFLETYRQLPNDWFYGVLAAINWMKASGEAGPRQFLSQSMAKLKRDSTEYYVYRLFYDLSGKVYAGETDMLRRADQESNKEVKARLLFYLANYYDIRGIKNLADRYFLQCKELNQRSLPEWRLNEWIMEARGILPY
ncbi:MAG: tetratricopeptide repeat protein [Treponema sp.]|jgi:tetratricopeptide (TPR) repeat protein|nr:tetratricopeptide repeat protein [Treponema sp.]